MPALTAHSLRTEFRANPLGLDETRPLLSWQLRGGKPGARPASARVLVAASAAALSRDRGDLWDTTVPAEDITQVIYRGRRLQAGQLCLWKVQVTDASGGAGPWSEPAHWSLGLCRERDWRGQWIGAEDGETGRPRRYFRNGDPASAPERTKTDAPALFLRREFSLPRKPRRAVAYFCGLGYGELHLNGSRVGDEVMAPIFTDYARRVCYVTHDVTSELRRGRNVVGAILGNGFFNLPTPDLFQLESADWRQTPRLRLDLIVEFADGSTTRIVSDGAWRWRTGPILFNCIRGGETIDRRIALGPWTRPQFPATGWLAVRGLRAPAGQLTAQTAPPMRVIRKLRPVALREARPGTWIADFGQNLTGWVELETRGPRGQRVQLEHNETLRTDGTLETTFSTTHTYGRFQRGEMVLSGGRDRFDPRFTYHGFRYAQLTGLSQPPAARHLRATLVHTDLANAGEFACSNPDLNRLHAAVRRTLLNSVHGMPAEEPTREKMGWTQDAQNTLDAYLYNFDAVPIYRKYLQDMIDGQEANGHVPPIVPTNGWGYLDAQGGREFCDDPWWGGSLAIVADRLYLHTGDRRILEHAYEPARRYVDWLASTARAGLVDWSLGDWLELGHEPARLLEGGRGRITPVANTSTAGYFHLTRLVAAHAAILGRPADATRYADRAAAIRRRYNAAFLRPDGWYQRHSQTAQAVALEVGLVPAERERQVRARLAEDLRRHRGHLSTGFIGLMPTLFQLCASGDADLAYRAVTQPTGSGWLRMLPEPLSTLGENIHPQGYGTNHHPFSACVGAWFFRNLAGIRPDPAQPGFQRVILKPDFVTALRWVKARHDCPRGRIAVAWQRRGSGIELEAEVPAGVSADVHLPARSPAEVTADGRPLMRRADLLARTDRPGTVIVTMSGRRVRFRWRAGRR